MAFACAASPRNTAKRLRLGMFPKVAPRKNRPNSLILLNYESMAACAAASRAIGTLNGEHDT